MRCSNTIMSMPRLRNKASLLLLTFPECPLAVFRQVSLSRLRKFLSRPESLGSLCFGLEFNAVFDHPASANILSRVFTHEVNTQGVRLAVAFVRYGLLFSPCVLMGIVGVEKESPKPSLTSSILGFLMKNVPCPLPLPLPLRLCGKTGFFPHCTPHNHALDTEAVHYSIMCLKIPSVYNIFACEMVRCAQELRAVEKMAAAGMGNKKIATTLGLPLSTTKRWLCRSKTQRKTRH